MYTFLGMEKDQLLKMKVKNEKKGINEKKKE